jgi:hypothetical protein
MTVMSYCGMVYFGLNACRETVPAIAEMPKMLDESLSELVEAARGGARRKPRASAARRSPADAPIADGSAVAAG